MKYFWAHWPRLSQRILAKRKKILFLDFDGTLAPICKHPKESRMNPLIQKALSCLSKSKQFKIVIISGRSLDDLQSKVNMSGIYYSGNYGMEIKGVGGRFFPGAKSVRKNRTILLMLLSKLKKEFQFFPGVLIEDKKFSISLHYRNVPREHRVLLKALTHFYQNKFKRYSLQWKQGKKVWEVFPETFWDKGKAALFFMKKFKKALPIVVGDDLGDEPMFKALSRTAISIRVGRRKGSCADYYFKSMNEVGTFLKKICV